MSSQKYGDEEIVIPVSVGKRLSSLCESDPACASTRRELLGLLDSVARECGRLRVEDLVGRRDLSSSELVSKLREDGYSQGVCGDLVTRAQECGLIDDARFGAAFARSKALSGWGRLKIERELARRGVSTDSIEGWPDDFVSTDEERDRALAIAQRRRLTGKNDYAKIVRFLCGRGFSPSIAGDVAREVLGGGF